MAIVAVSRRVQDSHPPFDKVRMGFGKPYNGYNREAMLQNSHVNSVRTHNGFNQEHMLPNGQNGHVYFPPARSHNGFNHDSGGGRPYGSRDAEIARNFHDQHEVVFRMLCSADRIGGVIGNSGAIVRALENELGASISVSYPAFDCNERIITITAFEVR